MPGGASGIDRRTRGLVQLAHLALAPPLRLELGALGCQCSVLLSELRGQPFELGALLGLVLVERVDVAELGKLPLELGDGDGGLIDGALRGECLLLGGLLGGAEVAAAGRRGRRRVLETAADRARRIVVQLARQLGGHGVEAGLAGGQVSLAAGEPVRAVALVVAGSGLELLAQRRGARDEVGGALQRALELLARGQALSEGALQIGESLAGALHRLVERCGRRGLPDGLGRQRHAALGRRDLLLEPHALRAELIAPVPSSALRDEPVTLALEGEQRLLGGLRVRCRLSGTFERVRELGDAGLGLERPAFGGLAIGGGLHALALEVRGLLGIAVTLVESRELLLGAPGRVGPGGVVRGELRALVVGDPGARLREPRLQCRERRAAGALLLGPRDHEFGRAAGRLGGRTGGGRRLEIQGFEVAHLDRIQAQLAHPPFDALQRPVDRRRPGREPSAPTRRSTMPRRSPWASSRRARASLARSSNQVWALLYCSTWNSRSSTSRRDLSSARRNPANSPWGRSTTCANCAALMPRRSLIVSPTSP